MQAKLTFTLPEEQHEFLNAVQAQDMSSVLFEIVNNLRRKYLKYREPEEGETYKEGVEEIFKDINDLLYDHGVIIE